MAVLWWDRCDDVYCGFWINWNYDAVRGSTLTLPTQWGLILVGFFALFVKLGSENLWGVICFIIHQLNASEKKQDDIYHQFQLVLRNTDSEQTFIQRLIKVAQAHKGMRFKVYRRTILFILLASVYGLGFYAVSGLSSRLIAAKDGSTVLALSPSCGYLAAPSLVNLGDEKSFEALNALVVVARNSYRKSATYARTCYGQTGDNTTACGTFVKTSLDYTTVKDEPCPFGDNMCSTKAIKFDTGLIRSDTHLGVNTKQRDSMSLRKTLTCAPLDGERYTPGWKPIPDELAPIFGVPLGTPYKIYEFGLHSQLVVPFNTGNNTAVADWVSWKVQQEPYGIWYVAPNLHARLERHMLSLRKSQNSWKSHAQPLESFEAR
ncbi:hypothetical protein P154DRAFT_26897 [Amniculicola lignicola CBS 123094]|uniref:Uncharacterized protein n=1 Tax=Amniculicola lignicola CBS 123094 TaxID=1392246 RepID=A0A6A5VYV6_9PLEO|nr:hypothetical protein P154DRAFT_26897 [Amniculicola lignicola CBS 123094]